MITASRFTSSMRISSLIILSCLWLGSAAHADCRARLHPLLLDARTEAAAVAAVRPLCEAEAAAGDVDALYQLALMDLGLAGRWHPDVAIPRMRSAAANGVAEAQYWLAWQHESGALLAQDSSAALQWYRRAAEQRHQLALARLVEAYEAGDLGLSPDPAQVMHYRALQSQCARRNRQGS